MTTCPKCQHKFIAPRKRPGTFIEKFDGMRGQFTVQMLLDKEPTLTPEQIYSVISQMVIRGCWKRVEEKTYKFVKNRQSKSYSELMKREIK